MPPQVEAGPACLPLSDGLQQDCPAGDPAAGLIDADYAFTDLDRVLAELLEVFRSSNTIPRRSAAHG